MTSQLKWMIGIPLVAVLAGGALGLWLFLRPVGLGDAFATSNGRIEATEIDISTKLPGRIESILVNEGELVSAGQVVAVMDAQSLRAQIAEAQAQLLRAQTAQVTAAAVVAERNSEKVTAEALVEQRKAQLMAGQKRYARTQALASFDAISQQQVDDDRASMQSYDAGVAASRSQVISAQAAIDAANSLVVESHASVAAAVATLERLQADLQDCSLKAPRDGRIQYRIAETGEVLAAGGKVLSEVDLADVYMTIFLPTDQAGRVALGSEVRLVLDAAPQYVIPAQVSFVASVAQFTPKTVETASEREKLMFRIKARIDPALLRQHVASVKTGIPGVAYVRLDNHTAWPEALQPRLPE